MSLTDILLMTKQKIALLIIILVASFPLYYKLDCAAGACTAGAICQCGFYIMNFYTIFVLGYLASSIIVELYNWVRFKYF
ncbi:MAG: hypothetical protein WCW13_05420 [archaeon]|jgi:hypothetical protein